MEEMVKVDGHSWSLAIRTDLYRAGFTEDGTEYSAESYYILLEQADGSRYAHFKTFLGCQVEEMEDYTSFIDIRKEAMIEAENLLQRIQEVGKINLKFWSEITPAYGSLAFQQINRF